MRDLGGKPVAGLAAYALPFAVPARVGAVRLAAELEDRVADVYSDLVRAAQGPLRREAALALREAAVRAVRWRGGGSVAFPGLVERAVASAGQGSARTYDFRTAAAACQGTGRDVRGSCRRRLARRGCRRSAQSGDSDIRQLTAERVQAPGGRSSLVVLVRQPDDNPAVLKVAPKCAGPDRERTALAHWNGWGAVQVLEGPAEDPRC